MDFNKEMDIIAKKVYDAMKKDNRVDRAIIEISGHLNQMAQLYMQYYKPDMYKLLEESKEIRRQVDIEKEQIKEDIRKQAQENWEIQNKLRELSETRAKEMVKGLLQDYLNDNLWD